MLRTEAATTPKLCVSWSSITANIVKRIGERFREHPYHFFTESDIHSLLFDIAEEELRQHNIEAATTSDGYDTSLVHHEYPTPFRCDMRGYKFEKRGEPPFKRGHYDLVVLNPAFVRANNLDIISSKNLKKFTVAMMNVHEPPLVWACEILFFPNVNPIPSRADRLITQDTLKVAETLMHKVGVDERIQYCKLGSTLVFTNHHDKAASALAQTVMQLSRGLKVDITLFTA